MLLLVIVLVLDFRVPFRAASFGSAITSKITITSTGGPASGGA
ncbi:MAG: hypothetical protein NVV63_13075 [Opitutus sp.]|nr:hypothetical protein [Opitutus sp.]